MIDVQGARQVRSRGIETVGIFVLPPSAPILEQRLRGRSKDSEEQIRRRLDVACREVGEFAQYEYVVVNDELEAAVERIGGDRAGRAGAGEGDAPRRREDHRDVQGTDEAMAKNAEGKSVRIRRPGQHAGPAAAGAARVPREAGEKKITIAQREVLRRKVEKIEDEPA